MAQETRESEPEVREKQSLTVQGGHFSALENAELLWDDVWDFIQTVVKH